MSGKQNRTATLRSVALKKKLSRAKRYYQLYILMIIPVGLLVIFKYVPMVGILLAFKSYTYADGFFGSPWNHFAHFKRLFSDPLFTRALLNTLRLSLLQIIFGFPMPIVFALLLNEVQNAKYKRTVQTISYLPHFLSWVIVGSFVYQLLSTEVGLFNIIRRALGLETFYYMGSKAAFTPIYIITNVWKSIGWSSVIYLASLSSVDPQLYEAAAIDGANRFRKAIHVSIPGILPVVTIQFILALGGILNQSYDAIMNLAGQRLLSVSDVLATFSYRAGLIDNRFDYATAISLFQNVVGFVLILIVNSFIRRVNEYALW